MDLVRSNRTLAACTTTLRKASRDPANRQELSELDETAVDMDTVKARWLKDYGAKQTALKSPDALLVIRDTVYLIEFKAGRSKNVKAHEIREKMLSAILVLSDLTGQTCQQMRRSIECVYVQASKDGIGRHVRVKAKTVNTADDMTDQVEGLNDCEGALFRRLHVLRPRAFDSFIRKQLHGI